MKRILLIFLVLLAAYLSAQVRYVRNIPIIMPYPEFYEYKYTTKQIFECPDGGIMVLGYCIAQYHDEPPRYAADCGVIKLDADGNCQWQWWSRNFFGSGAPMITGIDQEADGRVNFLISNYPYDKKGWIDPLENYIIQNLQLPGCEINRALRLSDNSIFAIGWNNPGTDLGTHVFFMHLNALGDTLSTRSYHSDSLWVYFDSNATAAYDMELDTDGLPVSSCIFTDRFASVVKTDWDGNIIWRRDTNYRTATQPIPLTKIPLTNEIVFGCQAFNNWNYNQFCLYKVTADGIDSLFTIQMTDSTCAGSYYSIVGHNQGIYLSGCYRSMVPGSPDSQEYISNYSLTGTPVWTWSYNSILNYQQLTDNIIRLSNNDIIHVFNKPYFGNYGLSVAKLHPDGTPNEEGTMSVFQNTLLAYPNPMKSSVNIEIKLDSKIKPSDKHICIYNTKGQLVRQIQAEYKSTDILTSHWDGCDASGRPCASGVYYIQCKADGTSLSKKLVLIK